MKEKERGSTCICIQSLFAWINNIRTLGTPLSLLIDILKKFLANKPQDLESLVIQVDEPVTLRPALPLDARRKILVASRPRTHTHTHTHTHTTAAHATRHSLPDADGALGGMHRPTEP